MVQISENIDKLSSLLEDKGQVFAILDENAASSQGEFDKLLSLLNGHEIPYLKIKLDENLKEMDTVLNICHWLIDKGADRNCFLLGVGGGVTTDLVGFTASIYKRGVNFGFVPTTLLAQIDASIGGKNGVNFLGLKNMLGCIQEPSFVYICPAFLETLHPDTFNEGVAEILKTFILSSKDNYKSAVELFSGQNGSLKETIAAAIKIKQGIVTDDLYEKGERIKLNLGHTFGHAIETLSHIDGTFIPHGEAVAIGIILAAQIADKIFKDDRRHSIAPDIIKDFKACGLPTESPYKLAEMLPAIINDKKVTNRKIRLILPYAIGDVRIEEIDFATILTLES